jgi:hypothetical protein
MKAVLILVGSVLAGLLLLIVVEQSDERKNRGYTWGYWGEFNTVSNCLAKLPGVTVTKAWQNADFLNLEEFGFDVLAQGRQVSLVFGEKDPARKLSGRNLERVLLEMIGKQSSNRSMRRMGASRSAQLQVGSSWWLAPTANAGRSGRASSVLI